VKLLDLEKRRNARSRDLESFRKRPRIVRLKLTPSEPREPSKKENVKSVPRWS